MGWRSWQLTHQPSCSSLNTYSGLLVQRLDLKDEKRQNSQSWSLSRTKARGGGMYCQGGVRCWRVGREEGGGRLWALGKSTYRKGGLSHVATVAAGECGRCGKRSQRGSCRNGSEKPERPWPPSLDYTAQWSSLGGPGAFSQSLVKGSWHLGPWGPAVTPAFSPVPSHSSQGPFTPLHQKNNSSICSHYLIFNCKSLKASHPLLLLI